MNTLSFPLRGYHDDFPARNTHSIFELVDKDVMYSIPKLAELSTYAKDKFFDAVVVALNNNMNDGLWRDIWNIRNGDVVPPFGWMPLATKKDGLEYQGSFIKRFFAWAWKVHNYKFPASFASEVGSIIGKDTSSDSSDVHHIRFDPIMQYDAGEFGDDGSCYWESRQGARMLIRNNGGSFIEFFDNPNAYVDTARMEVKDGSGLGRCWILPVNHFLSNEDMNEYAFVVCNFYADESANLNSYNMVRTIANKLGMGYTKIGVSSSCDALWINSQRGFLLSNNQELLSKYESLYLLYDSDYEDVDDPVLGGEGKHYHICERCGDTVRDNDDWHEDWSLCNDCYCDRFKTCWHCGDEIDTYNDRYQYTDNGDMCAQCLEELDYKTCAICGNAYPEDDGIEDEDGKFICHSCLHDFRKCSVCGYYATRSDGYNGETGWMCRNCASHRGLTYHRCNECNKTWWTTEPDKEDATKEDKYLCEECREEYTICTEGGCSSPVTPPNTQCWWHRVSQ